MYLDILISSYSHSLGACSSILSALQWVRSLPVIFVIFLLIIQNQLRSVVVVESKTLGAANWTRWAGYGGVCGNPGRNSSINDERFTNFVSHMPLLPLRGRNRQDSSDIRARLARDFIHVRLNIVHDKALEQEHANNPGGVSGFIRDFVYSLQLVYEQPEMSPSLKFNFVVTSIKLSSVDYPPDFTAVDQLNSFSRSSDAIGDGKMADLNVLLVYRTMGLNMGRGSKILGVATMSTFCNQYGQYGPRSMLIGCESLGSAVVFAHELAHAFNVNHDGEGPESDCRNTDHIMASAAGPERLTWSKCTIAALINFFTREDIAKCIYDPARINAVKPISNYFDLNPTTEAGSSNRKMLPGEIVNIDEQCSRYGEKKARSALTVLGQAESLTTCQSLICMIGRHFRVGIGPAAPGSTCKLVGSSKLGRCSVGRCNF